MIPRTFPSSRASNGSTQMIVYFLPSVSGLTRWVDYIPVKFTTVATAATENTYNQNGYIPVVSISSITGATPFKEYVPVFLDSSAADADVWDVTITGFIPVGTAGIGGAALYMDFAATTTLDPRVTFSRTTNATLTNSAGLVANAPMNLLTFSEQFDNAAWFKAAGTSISANSSTSPDGTSTADLWVKGSGTTGAADIYRNMGFAAIGVPCTLSLYFKAAGIPAVRVVGGASFSPNGQTRFDLSNGTVSTGTGSIQSVGNGWYRCSIFITRTSSADDIVYIAPCNTNGTFPVGNGVDGVLMWGAQLELGSTATTYNPTTVKNLLGFTEHFDNAAWTKSNAFVQANLLTYSQDFDNAAWVKTNATVTADTTVAPDGTQTADKLVENSTNSAKYLRATNGAASAGTVSFYAKAGERSHALVFSLTTDNSVVWFNLVTGTVGTNQGVATSTSITAVGNGWYRCQAAFPSMSANNVSIGVAPSNNTFSYAGDGTSGIFLWGAQLVQGTSAGDYKATYAAAAAVGYTDIYGQPFAQKLVEDTATNFHQVLQNVTVVAGTPYALSVYAKAGERNWMCVYEDSASSKVWFDLSTGTVGTVVNATANIQSLGNGWYRCTAIYTQSGTVGRTRIAVASANGTISYTGDGTSGIYIFGAQLSDSASVDPYVYNPVAAPSSVAYYGPRFDYDPVTLAPKGLLIEEQRTNLFLYSEQFENAYWDKLATTVSVNATVSPDDTVNADKLAETTATSSHELSRFISFTTGTAYTVSFYAKKAERSWIAVQGNSAGTVGRANFNLDNGTLGTVAPGTTASITPSGNGWYRCSWTRTATATASGYIIFYIETADETFSYAGTAGSGIFLWGAQLEAGAFATSYIPTVASQVTRAADSASMIGNNFARWYNQTEGTVYVDAVSNGGQVYAQIGIASISDDRVSLYSLAPNFAVVSGSTTSAALGSTTLNNGTSAKLAGAYKVNDFALSINGATALTDTTGSVANPASMLIGARNSASPSNQLNGTVKRIAYYNRRLANSELIGITS